MKFGHDWPKLFFENNGHMHVNSPKTGAENPMGSKFVHKHKFSVNLIISCQFFQ